MPNELGYWIYGSCSGEGVFWIHGILVPLQQV